MGAGRVCGPVPALLMLWLGSACSDQFGEPGIVDAGGFDGRIVNRNVIGNDASIDGGLADGALLPATVHIGPWNLRQVHPRLIAVATNGNNRLAVAEDAVVLRKASGGNWQAMPFTPPFIPHTVMADNGTFLVGGQDTGIAESADGLTWQAFTVYQRGFEIDELISAWNETWAVGGNFFTATIWQRGTDNQDWAVTANQIQGAPRGASFDGDKMVIVGTRGLLGASNDGTTWDVQAWSGTPTLHSVTWGSSGFVAVGEGGLVLRSADGTSWQSETVANAQMHSVAFGRSTYVAVGTDGRSWQSADGTGWQPVDVGVSADLRAVMHDGQRFVAVGNGSTVATSVDGATWNIEQSQPEISFHSVVHANDQFVAVGSGGTLLVSTDGDQWTPSPGVDSSADLRSVAIGDGTTVAAGDGLWTADASGSYTKTQDAAGVRSVAFGDGFVAVGEQSQAWYSSDGTNWHSVAVDAPSLSGVAYHKGHFLAVGIGDGKILRSPDGMQWTQVADKGAPGLKSVASNGETIVAISGTHAHVSFDGQDWTSASFPITGAVGLESVSVVGRAYAASGPDGQLYFSGDGGMTWNPAETDWRLDFAGVARDPSGTEVLVGEDALILSRRP